MRHLLVINPNTSEMVSALLHQHAQQAAGTAVQVRTATARFGAPYIACEASYLVAGHATLDAWAAAQVSGPAPDAVLIGCFGDPGLQALQDSSAVPVTGLAEASMLAASRYGRYAIVTGGVRWKPILQRLAQSLGHVDALAGIHTVAPSGAQLAADPAAAQILLTQACQRAVQSWAVQAVILGGAGLAGMAALIQPQVRVPVIDSVLAGTHHALQVAVAMSGATGCSNVAWQGVSAELVALGQTDCAALNAI